MFRDVPECSMFLVLSTAALNWGEVVYREVDKYRFAEGEAFPRFEPPRCNTKARKLASVKHRGFKTGKWCVPLQNSICQPPYIQLRGREGRGGIPIR